MQNNLTDSESIGLLVRVLVDGGKVGLNSAT